MVLLWLGAGFSSIAKAQGGSYRAYLPLVYRPAGSLSGYLVVLNSDYDGDQDIYTVRADGTDSTQLTFDDTATIEPQFAPDGSLILFRKSESATEDDYYVMDTDGSDMRPVVELLGRDDLARWSPRSDSIAFRNRNPNTSTFDLYWAALDGEEAVLVQTNVQTFAWAPNGTYLAYTVARLAGSVTLFDLYVYTPTTATSLLLISDTNKNFGWSPNSAMIAFSARRSNNNELFIINPQGNDLLQLTTNAVDDDFVGWVEGGARIAFTRALAALESPRNIYLLRPDGSGESRLTNSSDFKQVVSISPEGRHLIYSRVAESGESQRLYLQATDTTTSIPISDEICTQTSLLICGWGTVTWAHDSRQLVYHQFIRPRQGSGSPVNKIYLTELMGNGADSELLSENSTSPVWLLGSPYILLTTPPVSGIGAIPHSMDTRTADRQPLTRLEEDAFNYDWEYVGAP